MEEDVGPRNKETRNGKRGKWSDGKHPSAAQAEITLHTELPSGGKKWKKPPGMEPSDAPQDIGRKI